LVIGLGVQVAELKEMIGQIVSSWDEVPHSSARSILHTKKLEGLSGAWLNEASESNLYIQTVRDQLVAPYCWAGNDKLTAFYYDWKEMGEYLFARFKWVSADIHGFTFLKAVGDSSLQGAWWYDEDVEQPPTSPPKGSGNPSIWRRTKNRVPSWAARFFEEVDQGSVKEFSV
jgi:hypothetical protein